MSTHEAPKDAGQPASDSPPQTSQKTPPPAPPPPSGSGGVSQVVLQNTVDSGKKLYNERQNSKSPSELKELAKEFANGYKTDIEPIPESRGENYYNVVTVPKPVPGEGRYHTYINVITGDIVIDYIGRDAKVERSFPCSEILYQQFKQVCAEKNVTPKLTKITQEGVTGGGTGTASSQQIITSYITQTEEKKSFDPGSDGFYAVLGTINGKNAVYLIKDHGVDLKIADISGVVIFFKKTLGMPGRGKLCFSVSFSS